LQGNPDLQGNQIDFIRLVITRMEIGPCCADGGGFDLRADIIWQIWGTPESLHVAIDIKPGDDANCVKNDGHGVIPVAILGSANLDVTEINPATVQLAGLAVKTVGKSEKLLAHIEDVNADNFPDLMVQIQDNGGAFSSGTTTATLTGMLFDGTPIEGMDTICIVP
jgi:hypothetical protein